MKTTDNNIFRVIDKLTQYGLATNIISKRERVYTTNLLLDTLNLNWYDEKWFIDKELQQNLDSLKYGQSLQQILLDLQTYAIEQNLIENSIEQKDIFDSKIMNCLTPRPDEVTDTFWSNYSISPIEATNAYYKFSHDTDYIRRYRLLHDVRWSYQSDYGNLELLISLSKPEKSPRAIAFARQTLSADYPKCALCYENEGYRGRIDAAPRQNHRVIPLTLANEEFSFQFSPYGYCNHHCIVLNNNHSPMVINPLVIQKLLEFLKFFPHYFIGSNADLPYVGGSILSHEHFQGGWHELPIMNAKIKEHISIDGYDDIVTSLLYWPISTIKLEGKDISKLVSLGGRIIEKWAIYNDKSAHIYAVHDNERCNTITPLAHKKGDSYILYLMLRNNIRTEERPDGKFHIRPSFFHIKQEGLGIIDVPGLVILPPRLKKELELIKLCITQNISFSTYAELEKHKSWIDQLLIKFPNLIYMDITQVLQKEIGLIFQKMLEDGGVFKQDSDGWEYFRRFIKNV